MNKIDKKHFLFIDKIEFQYSLSIDNQRSLLKEKIHEGVVVKQ
jgi:hypothetical protein